MLTNASGLSCSGEALLIFAQASEKTRRPDEIFRFLCFFTDTALNGCEELWGRNGTNAYFGPVLFINQVDCSPSY